MDLNALNQSVLRLIENGTKIISFLKDFTVGSAGDVSITYINADGSESVRTFPNIAKMVATYNITNDNGVIRDMDGNWLIDKIYTETKDITCEADTPIEVFNLCSLQNVTDSTFLIDISWDNALNADGNTRIWRGGLAGIFHTVNNSYVYNGTPALDLDLIGNVHHKSIALPTFTIDSDETKDKYGNSIIVMDCVEALTFKNLKIKIRRVM